MQPNDLLSWLFAVLFFSLWVRRHSLPYVLFSLFAIDFFRSRANAADLISAAVFGGALLTIFRAWFASFDVGDNS